MPKAIRFIPSSWVTKPKRGRERHDDQLRASGAGGGPLGKPCHEPGMLGFIPSSLVSEGQALNAGFHQSGRVPPKRVQSCSETPASAVNFSRMDLLDEGNAGVHRDGISPTGPWVFSVSPQESEPSIEGKWRTEVHSSRNLMDRGGSMRENQYPCQDLKNPGEQASAGEVSGPGSSSINNPVCSQSTNASFWLICRIHRDESSFSRGRQNRRSRFMIPSTAPTMSSLSGGEPENWLPLEAIFAPRTVAVIGATERQGSVGQAVLWNLISNPFGGTVYPINSSRPNVLGIKAYKNIKSAPDPIDLAVVVTPAATVPGVISECVDAGVTGAIVISAGFKESGPEGARLEQELLKQARRGRMRIIGPNCVGVMRPYSGMNATFTAQIARPGSVGFITQSGALCTAILDWSFQARVGFSAFVSIGSMLDVGWGDLIDYLGDDPYTKCIVIYMESIGDARSFLSASREVALAKPIIVIKAGRTEAAAKAAASHTGSLTGSDEVLDAAFRRVGVLRVNSISELFDMAEVLSKQPRPKGPRLAILTNAGGPGVLATDALIENRGELAPLSPETMAALDAILPAAWSHSNPIDILGDADPKRYASSLEVTAKDPNIDGLLAILTPQAMTNPTATAEHLRQH